MADTIQNSVSTPVMLYGRNPSGVLQAVTTDGNGNLNITGGGGGGVTSVTGTAPITSTGGTTPAIGCATCTTSAAAITNNVLPVGSGGGQGLANSTITDGGLGVTIGSPTGGAQGAGTLNATGLFINGVAASTTTGTVTSVSFTGGLISVATPTTTPALTVAGTSGGIPYFSGAATWASSAALTANVLVKGGGAGVAPSNSSITDNGTTVSTTEPFSSTGIITSGANGGTAGQITLNGSTSGSCTIIAPAVAGTAGNAITFSNAISSNSTITSANGGFVSDVNHGYSWSGRSFIVSGADGVVTLENNAANGFSRLTLGPASSSFPAICNSGTSVLVGLANGNCTSLTGVTTGTFTGNLYSSGTNCSSSASPAVCAAAAAGSVVIAAAATSVQVNTTAVTANSQIIIVEDSSLGAKLSVTCNTQSTLVVGSPTVTARTAGSNFTISVPVAPTTNPICYSYFIIN